MTYTSLDAIVKSVLLKMGYSLHFYLRFLVSARDIMQTLIYDDGLIAPNTTLLCVNKFGEAELPCDFIDDIQVGIRVGAYIRPLVRKEELSSLRNTYPDQREGGAYEDVGWGYLGNIGFATSYFNEYGEALGRLNIGAGVEIDTYKIVKERSVIKFHPAMRGCQIVLTYVSGGGNDCNCATMGIDPMAKEVIEAYIIFDRIRNSRNAAIAEKELAQRNYTLQRKIFRARKNKMGIQEAIRTMRRAYFSAAHS